MKTLRLKVRPDCYAWLNEAAIEVNQVWNWANEVSAKAARPYVGARKFLSGYDIAKLTAGASSEFSRIASGTIREICIGFAIRRKAAKKSQLRWRISSGARRSLGWVPFKTGTVRRHGNAVRFIGKTIRIFEADLLPNTAFKSGSFSQDSIGDWWFCLPIDVNEDKSPAPFEAVGIDLGLKTIATTSDGETLESGRWTLKYAAKLAMAQRRGHRRQAKRIHRKIARCRSDAIHKFSRSIVGKYQTIVIGDVSSSKLVKTKMAKSVLDSGWGMLKLQLQYKGEHAGRSVQVVNESYTTKACSSCGALTGPSGVSGLSVRSWTCDCGVSHDRDVNAARNILLRAEIPASMRERNLIRVSA